MYLKLEHEAGHEIEAECCLQNKALKAKQGGVSKDKKSSAGHTAKGKAFYKGLTAESDYQGEDYDVFSSWLGQTA